MDDTLSRWRTYHIFYHADRSRLLRRLVHPLAASLLRERIIDRFYFVRYSLGGPHIRLRWRLSHSNAADDAEAALSEAADDFFVEYPSLGRLDEDLLLRTNESIIRNDTSALHEDGNIYPDNSWRLSQNGFEIERYGGIEHFCESLDLFCISSVTILLQLEENDPTANSLYLAIAFRFLLDLAWAFADNRDNFFELAGYYTCGNGVKFQKSIAKATAIVEQCSELLVERVCGAIRAVHSTEIDGLAGAALRFASLVRQSAASIGLLAKYSHIHMTLNRLGLSNSEEAYLSQILVKVCETLSRQKKELWDELWKERELFAARANRYSLTEMADAQCEHLIGRNAAGPGLGQ